MNTYHVTFTEPSGKIWTTTVKTETAEQAEAIVAEQHQWAENVQARKIR